MSRNKEYEQRMKNKGLKKITIWVPEDRELPIKEAIALVVTNKNLTFNTLRDIKTGRFVSILRHQ